MPPSRRPVCAQEGGLASGIVKAWVIYSIARIGVFALACFVLWMLLGDLWGQFWWLGVICAAIIAFCISYIFFGRMKARVVEDLAARSSGRVKAGRIDIDAQAEDVD